MPLGFVRLGPTVFLVARERSSAWPVRLLRSGVASLTVEGDALSGKVGLVVDPSERQRILRLFEEKYGAERFARWYARPARVVRVQLDDRSPELPHREGYRAWLQAEFDNVADDYDRHITGNTINRLLRDRSLERLRGTFGNSRRLLEIGCGSGVETLPLLHDGHEIVAVDLSERMLNVVREKARAEGVADRLRTVHASAHDLPQIVRELGEGSFDGAYSTYGAMNCEPDLSSVAPALHALLATHGRFVAGVYNRWCAFEAVAYTLVGKWGRATGRRHRPVEVGASRFCVDVYALSPHAFASTFSPWFVPVTWEAVPLALPPSDLTSYADRFSSHFATLARWDRALGRLPGLRSLGDHFLMVLDRSDRPNGAARDGTLAPS